ncbi:hypothetical protein [Psychrilyobacter atlanticus]|uniref:hypothetical protein n=1 Tax=Psychrilyobacter atlanticus TaxID=271091 RepID=UPI00041EB8C0|nr:hypothetical protein [Psychrilyobacter atlanticus]
MNIENIIDNFLENEYKYKKFFPIILNDFNKLSIEKKEKLCLETKNSYHKGMFYSSADRTLEALYYLKEYFNCKIKFKDAELLNFCLVIARSGALNYLKGPIVEKFNKMEHSNIERVNFMLALADRKNKEVKRILEYYINNKIDLIDLDYPLINDALLFISKDGESLYSELLSLEGFDFNKLDKSVQKHYIKKYFIKKLLFCLNLKE